MPSPIRPSDFCGLVPEPGANACDVVKRKFFEEPQLLCNFFQWLFNEDGSFRTEVISLMSSTPPGTVIDFAGTITPERYLDCNGAAYSRADYAALFANIGTLWGSGDGSTTFNVPNLPKLVLIGAAPGYQVGQTGGSSKAAAVPDHKHGFGFFADADSNDDAFFKQGDFTTQEVGTFRVVNGESGWNTHGFVAGVELKLPSTYALVTDKPFDAQDPASDSNMQAYAVVRKLIRY